MLAVVWSPACAACATPLAEPTRGLVCRLCWDALAGRGGPPRAGGGAAAPYGISFLTGAPGRGARTAGRAAGAYEGRLRAILHAFKYDGHRSLARPLAQLLRRAGADLLAGADLVVPVPLHWRRRRRRGFNQAAELAAHLGLPVADVLRRKRATPSQVGLSRPERARSVHDAIALAHGWSRALARAAGRGPAAVAGRSAVHGRSMLPGRSAVRGRSVVLVDDVLTTGATIEACAAVLRAAGAGRVRALTVAQAAAPPPAPTPPPPRPRAARRRSAPSPGRRPNAGSSP